MNEERRARAEPRQRVDGHVDEFQAYMASKCPTVEAELVSPDKLLSAHPDSDLCAVEINEAGGAHLLLRVGRTYDYQEVIRMPLGSHGRFVLAPTTWRLHKTALGLRLSPSVHVIGKVHCFLVVKASDEQERAADAAGLLAPPFVAKGRERRSSLLGGLLELAIPGLPRGRTWPE